LDLIETKNFDPKSELQHWWIKTRLVYIDYAIKKLNRDNLNIIEYGSGTCQNILHLINNHKKKINSIYGIDPNIGQNIINKFEKFTNVKILRNDESIKKFDLFLALDVLEHTKNDFENLKYWLLKLKNNGIIVITVPAFNHLWSYHDISMKHKRRYTIKTLNNLTKKFRLKKIMCKYFFMHMYLPALVVRKLIKNDKFNHMQIPNSILNNFLYTIGKIESKFSSNPFFGTSVLGIYRKKDND
jgi:hypothetical protein